jgi:DHA1 family bicyclomycin/chloramphenicol resistance-like MFS transporter
MRGYWELGASARFVLLALASGVPFNGMFLYVLGAPAFLGDHLGLAPTEFFWFFLLTISGIMWGAWLSGRLAGKIAPKRQIRHGFVIMLLTSVLNLLANLLFPAHASWALLPIAVFAFGWALMVPVVTLLVLDLYPARRGMASSLQAFVGSVANGTVAGVLVPLVMHSTVLMALSSLLMMGVGLASWVYLHHRWPEIGRSSGHG